MKNSIFKISTGLVGVYHVILGAIALLLPVEITAQAFQTILGISLNIDAQLLFIGKFVGVYMLVFGIMLILVASNPVKYRVFAWPAIVLFGIRLINRIFFFTALTTTLGMSPSRNIIGTIFILIFFVVMWVSMPKKG